MAKSNEPVALWKPTDEMVQHSRLQDYLKWLAAHKNLHFKTYPQAWQWSVGHVADFWESIWQYFDIISHQLYREVLPEEKMPGALWFAGSTLNYAEHVFRDKPGPNQPAILFSSERHELVEFSWEELKSQVASMAAFLKECGIGKGDRVAAFLPNIPEATIAFLATISIGAVWSSCSPDFGANSVVDRFAQIGPKVLFVVDGYTYGGKPFDKTSVVKELYQKLPSIEQVVLTPYLDPETKPKDIRPDGHKTPITLWNDTFRHHQGLSFEPVPFDHPIYILYSSGTTGIPKAITHSHGGNLLEHYKYLALHNDVHPGERFFWFSTTGWMMWNFVQASALVGATLVLFDGSPGYPSLDRLWELAEKAQVTHFGASAPFLVACMKEGLKPGGKFDLSKLRTIGSTGSPLPPEAFDWVYENVKKDVWLSSMAGGTDVCTAWVGGCPFEPVYKGEIQVRCLGAAIEAWNENGEAVVGEVGELMVTKPMPSMPIYFWDDADYQKYLASYFENHPGVWRHGDWVEITERHTVIIYGRSDATLNRQGVRIGTAEVYRAVDKVPEIKDSLIVCLELDGGRDYMPLFVVVNEGGTLTEGLKKKINQTLRSECSPRHVPDEIIAIPEIPYTMSGKKMETPVKKILMGKPVEQAANLDSMKNPAALEFFKKIKKT